MGLVALTDNTRSSECENSHSVRNTKDANGEVISDDLDVGVVNSLHFGHNGSRITEGGREGLTAKSERSGARASTSSNSASEASARVGDGRCGARTTHNGDALTSNQRAIETEVGASDGDDTTSGRRRVDGAARSSA